MTEVSRVAATPSKQEATTSSNENEPRGKSDSIRNDDFLPLVSYRKEKGKPYSVDYFKLMDWHDLKHNPELDVDGLLGDVDSVEEYIEANISDKKLSPDTETFDFLMKNILESIGDMPTEMGEAKIKRIAIYIRKSKELDIKYKELNELKRQIDDAQIWPNSR